MHQESTVLVKAHCWVHCDLKKRRSQNQEALCWATLNEFREIDNEDIVAHFVLMGWESSNILSQRGHPRKHFMFYSMYCLPPPTSKKKKNQQQTVKKLPQDYFCRHEHRHQVQFLVCESWCYLYFHVFQRAVWLAWLSFGWESFTVKPWA